MVYGTGFENRRGCKPSKSSNLFSSATSNQRRAVFWSERVVRCCERVFRQSNRARFVLVIVTVIVTGFVVGVMTPPRSCTVAALQEARRAAMRDFSRGGVTSEAHDRHTRGHWPHCVAHSEEHAVPQRQLV